MTKPHPFPPTHPNLAAGFSIFPFLGSHQPSLHFPDLLHPPLGLPLVAQHVVAVKDHRL